MLSRAYLFLWVLLLPWVLSAQDNQFKCDSPNCSIAPAFFSGKVVQDTHVLSWGPSANSQVVGYRIFQGKILVSETTAQEPNKVTVQNRIAGRNYTYKLVSFIADGTESCPLIITLGPSKNTDYTKCCKHRQISFTAITINPTDGGTNGKVIIKASGGIPPYQYSLNQGAFQSSHVFKGLAGGTYSVVIKDCENRYLYGTVTLEREPVILTSY